MGESVALNRGQRSGLTGECHAQLDTCPARTGSGHLRRALYKGHGHREGYRAGVNTGHPLRTPQGMGSLKDLVSPYLEACIGVQPQLPAWPPNERGHLPRSQSRCRDRRCYQRRWSPSTSGPSCTPRLRLQNLGLRQPWGSRRGHYRAFRWKRSPRSQRTQVRTGKVGRAQGPLGWTWDLSQDILKPPGPVTNG